MNGSVDVDSYRELLKLAQPYGNHNGGQLLFNKSLSANETALLYVTFGDGGFGGDSHSLAQDRSSWFGNILRLDAVSFDNSSEYGTAVNSNLTFHLDLFLKCMLMVLETLGVSPSIEAILPLFFVGTLDRTKSKKLM